MTDTMNDTASTAMRERYLGAMEFGEMLATVTKHEALWASVWRRAEVDDAAVQRLATLGGMWHLLVLSEDWCGDAVNTVPVVARLAELAPNADVRVLARDANLDLMDTHLTGTSRSIPIVIVLDEQWREVGWWGPRPAGLQAWVMGPGKALEQEAKYREVRAWYARDRGRSTVEEIVRLIERVTSNE
jgi:hypothetical protein